MTDEGAEVIELTPRLSVAPAPEQLDAPIVREPRQKFCRHEHVSLNVPERKLTCRDCELVIDPVEWLEQLAAQWDRYAFRLRSAVVKTQGAERDLADVERRLRNAKARMRKAGRGNWVDLEQARGGRLFSVVRGLLPGRLMTVAPDGGILAPIGPTVEATLAALRRFEDGEPVESWLRRQA